MRKLLVNHTPSLCNLVFTICLVLVFSSESLAQEANNIRSAAGEMGQEVKELEKEVIETSKGASKEARPKIEVPEKKDEKKETGNGKRIKLASVVFEGDRQILIDEGLLESLVDRLTASELGSNERNAIIESAEKELQQRGFYLADLWAPPPKDGTLVIDVDVGRIGEVEIEDFAQKYFSKKQIEQMLEDVRPGDPFNYNKFYDSIYSINTHPDITVDTDMKGIEEVEGEKLRRLVDMSFAVKEKIPLHGVFDINNYGTDATDNWGASLTLQHLNLTKHNDVLTLQIPFSIDMSSLRSVASSYRMPYKGGKGGAVTLYGGYSELDSEDVVDQIDIRGDGWFAGLQGTHHLVDDEKRILDLSLGVVRRVIEDQLIVQDVSTDAREVTLMPFSLALSYASKDADALGGRNFLTLESIYNQGDFLGTSDKEEMDLQRRGADADYFIERLQYARIQPVSFSGKSGGNWILFFKTAGQYASGALVPAEQMGVGGSSTVRGYKQREFLGDHALVGNLELRTPLLLGLISSPFVGDKYMEQYADNPVDRLQLVGFVDGGFVKIEDALPGEEDSQELLSVGLGLRIAVTQYAQLKFDWGFPLEETDESNSSGTGHINLQMQF